MQKLAKADVLIVNGLGMEEFLGAPVAKQTPVFALSTAPKALKKRWHTTRATKRSILNSRAIISIQGHADQGEP